jgi:AraC-like DNA-binding protein
LTYLFFGAIILWNATRQSHELALVRLGHTDSALRAMILTGLALMCSAFMDLYVIVDFIRTGGQNIGLFVTLIQTGFLLCIGLAAITGQSGATQGAPREADIRPKDVTQEDSAIVARLIDLFETERLHTDTELNLRRLSRRLTLPDRSVSQAINKTQNMSLSQFVNTFRIRDACKLLKSSDQSILQISLAAGFMSKSNFNREFTRITGKTPSQWRSG